MAYIKGFDSIYFTFYCAVVSRYEKDKKEYDNKLKYTEDTEKLTGKKSKGRVLKEPDSTPNDKDQINLTDDESRIMPVSGGGYMQAYNGQASVEHDSRLREPLKIEFRNKLSNLYKKNIGYAF